MSHRFAVVALTGLALAACQNAAEEPAAAASEAAAPAVATTPPAASSAAPSATPSDTSEADKAAVEAVIARIVESYRQDSPGDLPLSAGFQRAWDRALGGNGLDADPFCGCQDYDTANFRHRTRSITVEGDRAVAQINLEIGWGEQRAMRLTWVRQGSAWKLDDMDSPDGPSLKREMASAEPGSWGIPPE